MFKIIYLLTYLDNLELIFVQQPTLSTILRLSSIISKNGNFIQV